MARDFVVLVAFQHSKVCAVEEGAALGVDAVPLALYKSDWVMAFRQTPKHPKHRAHTYEIWWNHKT